MAEITKDVRNELRSALKRIGVPVEIVAVTKRITDAEQLHATLQNLNVSEDVLALLKNYRTAFTDGEIIEVLQSMTPDPELAGRA